MGNSQIELPKQTKVKAKPELIVEQPKIFVQKIYVMPSHIDNSLKENIQILKVQMSQNFIELVKKNMMKEQIRTVLTMPNLELYSPKTSQSKIKNITCSQYDIEIYKNILEIRMEGVAVEELTLLNMDSANLQDKIKKKFQSCCQVLISEIKGKTNIWRSLNLSQIDKKAKMRQFLTDEGIKCSKFQFLSQ